MNRSHFENKFPVPEGMIFDEELQRYIVRSDIETRLSPEIIQYNTRWETWQRFAGRTPPEAVIKAKLEVGQCEAPRSKWHWTVILQNGHFYQVSEIFDDQHEALRDAAVFGIAALQKALWMQDTQHLFTDTPVEENDK